MRFPLITVLFLLLSANVVAQAPAEEVPANDMVKPGLNNVILVPVPKKPKAAKVPLQKLLETAGSSIVDDNLDGLTWALDNGLPPDARFSDGNPIIIRVCFWGNIEMLKALVSKGANINIKGVEGLTPLMTAVKGNKSLIVEYLVKMGADKKIRNDLNWTAFDFAKQNGDDLLMFMTKF